MSFKFANLLGAPYRGGTILMHGAELFSPVGNRVSVVDLAQSRSSTLPSENAAQIRTLSLSPDGRLLLSIDVDGRAMIYNWPRRVLLHHFSFKSTVRAAAWSPDGKYLAVGVGRLVQVWHRPELQKSVAPMRLARTFGQPQGDVVTLSWSPDGKCLAAGAEDLTVRVFHLRRQGAGRPPTLMGHRTPTVAIQFASEAQQRSAALLGQPTPHLWTLSQDGALFTWTYFPKAEGEQDTGRKRPREEEEEVEEGDSDEEDAEDVTSDEDDEDDAAAGSSTPQKTTTSTKPARKRKPAPFTGGRWSLTSKYYFNQRGAKLTAASFHPSGGLLAAGFSNGVFDLLQLPEAAVVHTLSMGQSPINSMAWNAAGDWVAAGSALLGQLLVWEWRAEVYALKQQGHAAEVASLAYSPDGALLATGGDDARVKVWTPSTGFCFVTFREHAAPVTGVAWLPTGAAVVSASLDGTVRAFDLVRYRCFRTLTAPEPAQFISLAVDPAGEIVCAGAQDGFQIYVWSLKTGRLLDVLAAHEGPVTALAFAPGAPLLASGSWDKTVRTWDVFAGKGGVETLAHSHDVLALAWRPDARQLAASTLDGTVTFWDPHEAEIQGTIAGRRDIAGGRVSTDRRTAANASGGRAFTSLAYSADGSLLVAGGGSRFVCVYDVEERVLLRRIATTNNTSLQGVRHQLNSKNMTEAGPLDQINDDSDDDIVLPSALRLQDDALPGTKKLPTARTRGVALAPTGREWAAATASGVVIYSADNNAAFDPTDLEEGVTPEAALRALRSGAHLRALLLALRLNDAPLTKHVLLSVPIAQVGPIVRLLPAAVAPATLRALGPLLGSEPHLELLLAWLRALCRVHGAALKSATPALRDAARALGTLHDDLAALTERNIHTLDYLVGAGELQRREEGADASEESTQTGESSEEDDEEEDDDA